MGGGGGGGEVKEKEEGSEEGVGGDEEGRNEDNCDEGGWFSFLAFLARDLKMLMLLAILRSREAF